MEDYRLNQSGQEVQDILNGAAMQEDLTAESQRAQQAEQVLDGKIDAEETRAKAAEKQNADDIDAIEEKIPSGASSSNKFATEGYVNDKVSTDTATFRGTYNSVSDLHLSTSATHEQIAYLLGNEIHTADNNDYCFVQIPTSAHRPTEIAKVERYKFNGEAWAFEYELNNSGFTTSQWAAINSGITSNDATKIASLPTNEQLTTLLNGLQGNIDTINEKIPSGASSSNKLATEGYVNDKVATDSATFRGTYNVVSDLGLLPTATHNQIAGALLTVVATADNNDYAFVQIPTSAEKPTEIEKIERYKFNGSVWDFEYELNNSGFTSAQWATINSGITSNDVAKLAALPNNDELTTLLTGLQGNIDTINEKIPSGASSENKLTTQSDVEAVASNLQEQINEIVSKDTTVSLSVSPTAVFADGTNKTVTFVATSSPTKATVVFDGGAPQEGTHLEYPVTVNSATPTTVSKTAQFTVKGISKGNKTATVSLVFPIYYGAGQSASVLNTGAMTAHSAIATPSFIQSITTQDNDYIFFEVPNNMANIQRLQLWDDPQFPTDLSIEAVETPREGYKAFKTVYTRLAGTHTYKVS